MILMFKKQSLQETLEMRILKMLFYKGAISRKPVQWLTKMVLQE